MNVKVDSWPVFLAATKQLYEWMIQSVFPSVPLSIRPSGYEMIRRAWSRIEEVPYCFSRSYVKLQGHMA